MPGVREWRPITETILGGSHCRPPRVEPALAGWSPRLRGSSPTVAVDGAPPAPVLSGLSTATGLKAMGYNWHEMARGHPRRGRLAGGVSQPERGADAGRSHTRDPPTEFL